MSSISLLVHIFILNKRKVRLWHNYPLAYTLQMEPIIFHLFYLVSKTTLKYIWKGTWYITTRRQLNHLIKSVLIETISSYVSYINATFRVMRDILFQMYSMQETVSVFVSNWRRMCCVYYISLNFLRSHSSIIFMENF